MGEGESWKMAKMTIKTNFHDNLAPFSQRKEAKLLNAKVAKCQSRRGGKAGSAKSGSKDFTSHTHTHIQWHTLARIRGGGRGCLSSGSAFGNLATLQTSFK